MQNPADWRTAGKTVEKGVSQTRDKLVKIVYCVGAAQKNQLPWTSPLEKEPKTKHGTSQACEKVSKRTQMKKK